MNRTTSALSSSENPGHARKNGPRVQKHATKHRTDAGQHRGADPSGMTRRPPQLTVGRKPLGPGGGVQEGRWGGGGGGYMPPGPRDGSSEANDRKTQGAPGSRTSACPPSNHDLPNPDAHPNPDLCHYLCRARQPCWLGYTRPSYFCRLPFATSLGL